MHGHSSLGISLSTSLITWGKLTLIINYIKKLKNSLCPSGDWEQVGKAK
jgi:hypothetical protein